jgi:hypothetical protein
MITADSELHSLFSGSAPAASHMAVYTAKRPVSNPRIANSKFFVLNSLHLATAIVDVELTQHCIANHQCYEANPLMPSSQAGQLSLSMGYVALGSFGSYWLKKRGSSYWWLPPSGGIAGHTVGIVSGIRNQQ